MAKPTRKRVLIIDAVRLSEDEADYLVSQQRERTETAISLRNSCVNIPKMWSDL